MGSTAREWDAEEEEEEKEVEEEEEEEEEEVGFSSSAIFSGAALEVGAAA